MTRPLACGVHEVHLWLADPGRMGNDDLHARLRCLLSEAERAREQRLHFLEDRLRYLLARAMVRTVLSRYAPVAPEAWAFDTNTWGRPQLAAHHALPDLQFNLSHTHGLIALAVSARRALGVDVEQQRMRGSVAGIAERLFSPAEHADLAEMAAAPERQQLRFHEYWTLKEAYIKARGMGLYLPLDRFSFDLARPGQIRIAFAPGFDDSDPRRWCFWQARPGGTHLLALCAQRIDGIDPLVRVRTVLPLVDEGSAGLAWCRTSVAP